MSAGRRKIRLGLQAKVLIPVLGFLVLLPAATMWIVNRHITHEMEGEAQRAVSTAESCLLKSLENRNGSVLERYRNVVAEARFKVPVELGDARTLEVMLGSQLEDLPETHEALLVVAPNGDRMASRRRSAGVDIEHFASAADRVVRQALRGVGATSGSGFDGKAYSLIAVPVFDRNGNLSGALAIAVRISEVSIRDLRLPHTEALLVTGSDVAVSTMPGMTRPPVLEPAGKEGDSARLVIAGEHFMARTGALDPADRSPPALRYLILSSYERRLQSLEEARRTLLLVSALGMLVSVVIVGWLVRRVTRPLRELNESAEAVGRGDFSRRITRFSNDECGDLAEAFNRMTASLQTSRTELERAMQQVRTTQEQLIQSEKLSAVGQFVAGVAHELNNPLTAVVGFSELLQTMSADEKIRGHLDRIAKSAHRCHKIVHSLLSFARQRAPERKLVDLNAVIEESLDIMTYDLRTSNVTVARTFESGLPKIMADRHQLQQVFVNILGNARQAIEPVQREGRIAIRTRHGEGRIVVEFQDNGPGIKPEHVARIFDPFFTTKPVGKGTGLGLSLCYGIIQEHGGKIAVRSEPGQGATFVIELPATAQGAETAPLAGASTSPFVSAARSHGANKSVLVIDDEQWILDLARELVLAEGHSVETATGGQQALELLGRRKFDVVVSDWKMPGLNGVRLFEHIRTTDPSIARRIVFMTGDVVSDTFQEFLRSNSLTCLSKPFAQGEFRAALAKVSAGAAERGVFRARRGPDSADDAR